MTTDRAPRVAPKVAIVGVRRVRTGLGQFFAKHLVAAGAEVPAFIASRKETIEEGRATLRAVGVDAEGFVDLDALMAAHPIDALVIASPHETHLRWLDAAVSRGLHVLCEKPLVWGGDQIVERAAQVMSAAGSERILFENCPWPYALPAFDALHPTARSGGVRSLHMEMSPTSSDPRDMLVDVLSHPISVLEALSPPAFPDDDGSSWHPMKRVTWTAARSGVVDLSFDFQGAPDADSIACSLRLRTAVVQPRPMALEINAFRADRRIRMDDYSLFLTDGAREVPMPDPMAALVSDFVRAIRHGEPPAARKRRWWNTLIRLGLLQGIVGSFPGP